MTTTRTRRGNGLPRVAAVALTGAAIAVAANMASGGGHFSSRSTWIWTPTA